MDELQNERQQILGSGEGGVQNKVPGQGLARTLEGVCQGGQDMNSSAEKLPVEVDYPKKPL